MKPPLLCAAPAMAKNETTLKDVRYALKSLRGQGAASEVITRDGSTDLFLAEKKGEQRLLLASAQKHWLKNLYRYAVLAEQTLPTQPAGLIATACASAISASLGPKT